jgi:hypothetical protein
MKPHRWIKPLSSAVLISLVLTVSNLFAETGKLIHDSILRKSATSSSPLIARLPTGTDVSLTSTRKSNRYYHVTLDDGREGWVLARNVSVTSPTPTPTATPTPTPTSTPTPTPTPTATATPTPTPTATPTATPTPSPGGNAFDPGCTLPFESIKQKHPIIDDSCSIDGQTSAGGTPPESKLAEDHAKNNFCLTGTPIQISYQNLLQLETDTKGISGNDLPDAAARKTKLGSLLSLNGQQVGEGTLVQITLFVIQGAADYADIAPKYKGENVNCNRLTAEENDIHIPLGQQTTDNEGVSVTAEMSPHFRPVMWTPDQINAAGQRPVRVTGQLFYDSAHRTPSGGRNGSPRASLWEIHPVYKFEVCTLNDIASCQDAPDSAWTPLDQFQP